MSSTLPMSIDDEVVTPAPADDAAAEAHERRVQTELSAQFRRLKDEAQALYGVTHGRRGARSPQKWAEMLEKAGDEIGNGRFLVRMLGAERYLEPETVAVLITLRQELLAERKRTTAADVMMVDTAVVAYYNFMRVQGWIGNMALVVERELFGQSPLNEIHGPETGARLREELQRLGEVLLPLLDRTQKMVARSLAHLR
ncbi:MAG TPA: hypothetical protein VHG92_14800 [Afifellaceae bacterium]|nr:hypothetical protein [Afifellaceae bacterium]